MLFRSHFAEKGHQIAACPVQQSEGRSDPTSQTGHPRPVRRVGAQKAQSHSYKSKQNENSRVMPEVRQVQRSTASQKHKKNNKSTFVKLKHRICYTCRAKGHMGKDCPNGNELNSNLVHYDFTKLRKDQAGTCAIIVIISPRISIRAIWVPKHLLTNLD